MALPLRPTNLRIEHFAPASRILGMGTAKPRLSWWLSSDGPESPPGDVPAVEGYQVEISTDGETTVHDVSGLDQTLVPWPGAALRARQVADIRVRVHIGDQWTEWSETVTVECGLLEASDWTASFVSDSSGGRAEDPAPILCKTFHIGAGVESARLYISALGLYRASINGHRVGADELTPGWTSYQHRLRYQTYDIADLLKAGDNRIEVTLGQGWYRGRIGFTGNRALYGPDVAALAQLELITVDGSRHTVNSGTDWTAGSSGILTDEIYDGQRTDMRVNDVECADPVRTVEVDPAILVAPIGPPVRVTEVAPAQQVFTSPSGKTLVDFGQNLVGWVRLRVRHGERGSEVVLRHAEVLENGELGVRPLRTAKATDSYLLSGAQDEVLEPCFTFHGFRYAEITGIGDVAAEDVEAVVIGSDLTRTGWFDSSHELLNQLHENVVWGTRGNFVDIPTDCPQRDERLGWTGDIEVFAPSASFLFDTAGFLDNWLADLAAEQHSDGSVPFVIPDVTRHPEPAAAAWSDAACIVPWVLYERFGDADILARQLPSMRAWVEKIVSLAGPDRLWSGGFQFGDWLDPTAPPDNPAAAQADPDVVATAYFARSTQILADAAEVVGDAATAQRYNTLAAEVRDAFAREYVTPAGRVLSDAPTVYAQALCWALLPTAEQRAHAGRRLADLVRASGFRISTGFVGTPLMTDALMAAGAADVAYRLLLQTGCPSWLYPVTMGATTIWERWDSMLPDGQINPGQMTSFNHYALGAVADWLHRCVAGLAPAAPGYRQIRVAPNPSVELEHASARHLTPFGEAAVSWRRADGRFRLDVTVPVGSSATIELPDGSTSHTVGAGRHTFDCADPCQPPGPLPQDATVRDLLDDPVRWPKLVELAGRGGGGTDEAALAGRLAHHLDRPAAVVAPLLQRRPWRADGGVEEQVRAILA